MGASDAQRSPDAPRRIDGRRLSHETSLVIRRLAVRRVEAGERPSDVIASFGLCRTSIYRWLRAKNAGGFSGLARRRHPGKAPRIPPERAPELRGWILGHLPSEYGIAGRLWTLQGVADLVRLRLGSTLTPMSAGRLLRRIGLFPRATLGTDPLSLSEVGASTIYAVNQRGSFLCCRAGVSATSVRQAMSRLTAEAGSRVRFGLGPPL